MVVEPDIAAAIASGNVPPNITVDYLMQNRDPPAIIALSVVGALTFIVVLLRCISRLFLVKSFGLDDGLAAFSVLIQIPFIALCIILINMGSGRHIEYIQYVLTEKQTNLTESLDFIAHLIYTSALFVCRLSGLTFYYRVCGKHDRLSIAIKCAGVFLVAAYIPQMCLIIFHCKPVTGLWPYAWQPKIADYVCLPWGIVYSVNSGLSLVCDFLLFAIPSAMIYSLKGSTRAKIQLSFLLFPGVLVIIISIFRLVLVVKGQWLVDGSWFYDPMLAIENAEIGGTLIALSVPGLKPLVGVWFGCVSSKSQSASGPFTYPAQRSHRIRDRSDVGSAMEVVAPQETSIQTHKRRPNESDDSLLAKDGIHVRKELSVESKNAEIKLDSYPKNW